MFDPSLQTIWGGDLIAVFCDTGWEHPDTYKHVNDVCLQMGVRLITLKSNTILCLWQFTRKDFLPRMHGFVPVN